MRRVIYSSVARKGLDLGACTAILKGAVANNTRSDITGVLLLKDSTFLQYLEGPPTEVERTLGIIRRDRRHAHVTVLADMEDGDGTRLFAQWRMGFYHLSASEAALGPGVLRNSQAEEMGQLAAAAPNNLFARMLDAFWVANKHGIARSRSLELVA